MSEYINTKGYIYLIKMCDTNYRTIYKIGKSANFDKRIKNYNYVEILNFIRSDNIDNDEKEIITIFKLKCKIDKGREFFTAIDDNFILKLFINYFNNKINNVSNVIITENIVDNNTDNTENVENIVDNNTDNNKDNTENVKNKEIIDNKIIGRTCPTCNKIFDYSSRLRAHLELTIHCKKKSRRN